MKTLSIVWTIFIHLSVVHASDSISTSGFDCYRAVADTSKSARTFANKTAGLQRKDENNFSIVTSQGIQSCSVKKEETQKPNPMFVLLRIHNKDYFIEYDEQPSEVERSESVISRSLEAKCSSLKGSQLNNQWAHIVKEVISQTRQECNSVVCLNELESAFKSCGAIAKKIPSVGTYINELKKTMAANKESFKSQPSSQEQNPVDK